LGKRITKSPKLYFYDVGLVTALMAFDKELISTKRNIYGALFENMVLVDLMKNFNAKGLRPSVSFFRDVNQNEIDLIIEAKGKVIPIEIKASETVSDNFFKALTWFQKLTENDQQAILVYGGNKKQTRTKGIAIPWSDLFEIL
jgi:predicted AAA+ superfamily ATPase